MKRQKKPPSNGQTESPALSSSKTSKKTQEADGDEKFLPVSLLRKWLFGLFIVAATLIAYQPVWHAGFIWDDDKYVTDNPALHSWAGLQQIWLHPGATVQYYPLTFTSFWLEYHLWGLNPLGYHLLNVLLHSFNAILFWKILQRLKVPGAWLAAAIFALHPVCVESVAWVTERKNTLSGLFYLSSLLMALEFWLPDICTGEGNGEPLTKRKYFWLAFVFYVCALWSKTAAAPLPVVILILVWWKRSRVIWRDVFAVLPSLVVGLAMSIVTIYVEKQLGSGDKEWNLSLAERCVVAGRDLWFYLGKLLWPHPLVFVYPRWNVQTSDLLDWIPFVAGLALLCILWLNLNRWGRSLPTALSYFLVLLFPILGFLSIFYFRYSFVADHFQYLASLSPIALAAAAITRAFGFLGKRNLFLKPLFCGVLLLTLGVLTWRQCGIYADAETLWETTLVRNPDSYLAENNLGLVLFQSGRVTEAIMHYQRALQIDPNIMEAHNNLGNALFQNGNVDEAIAQYQQALQINPDYTAAHYNFGSVLFQLGRVDEAITHFQKALQISPDYTDAHNSLGLAFFQKGQMDEALDQFKAVLKLDPNYSDANFNLGNVYFQKNQLDEAVVHYQKALEINPNDAEIHNNLGIALQHEGRVSEAVQHWRKALEIQPNNVFAQNNLAWVLATCPDPSIRNATKAVELAKSAYQLSGGKNHPGILKTLAAAYANNDQFVEAVETTQKALQLATDQSNTSLVSAIQIQMKFYQAGLPFRDTSLTNTPDLRR
jgi:protein O-mannosyl-transferase